MATYFQSSSTCERGRGQNNKYEKTEGKCPRWQMKDEVKRDLLKSRWGEVPSERKRGVWNLRGWEDCGSGWGEVRITQQGWKEGKKQKNEDERKELNSSCKPTENWYIIYTGGNYYDNHIQTTASKEATGVLTKLIEPQVLHIKGCFSPLGDFTHCIYNWRREEGELSTQI